MLKPLYLILLISLFASEQVMADVLPVTSGMSSETCANLTGDGATHTITQNSANLSYRAVPVAKTILRYRPRQAVIWQYGPGPDLNSRYEDRFAVKLAGLQPGTVYDWQLAMQCSLEDTSAYGAVFSFTTVACTNTVADPFTERITTTSAIPYWNETAYELNPDFIVQWRRIGATTWNVSDPVRSPGWGSGFRFTNLTPQTAYEWRVANVCTPTQFSAFTNPISFTTATPPTDCPAPTSLVFSNVSCNKATLSWIGFTDGLFDLQYQTQGADSWTTITGISGSSYTINAPSGAYNWRVRASCSGNQYSDYSYVQSFGLSCSVPSLDYQPRDAYSIEIRPGYTLSGGPFILQWRQAGTTDWTITRNESSDRWGTNKWILTGLKDKTGYEMRLQQECSTSCLSGFSDVVSFTPTAPVLNTVSIYYTTSPYIQWNGFVGLSYVVDWRKAGTDDWQTSPVLNGFGISYFGYWIGDVPEGNYEFRIETVSADGSESAYTPIQQFYLTTCTNSSVERTYAECVSGGAALISWYDCLQRSGPYSVRWRQSDTDCWQSEIIPDSLYFISFPFSTGQLSHTYRHTIKGLTPYTAYEYQLGVPWATDGIMLYTAVASFSTQSGVPFPLPDAQAGSTKATVSWRAACWLEDASYQLQYRPVGTTSWLLDETHEVSNYSFTGLSNNTAYEWRIRWAGDNGQTSQWSFPATFTTSCPPTGQPYQAYSNTSGCADPAVSWVGCKACGLSYDLRYRLVSSVAWSTTISLGEQNSYTLANLPQPGDYEVQVRAKCGTVLSTFSTSGTINANCTWYREDPKNPCQYNITDRTAVLQWQASGSFELRWRPGSTTIWNTVTIPHSFSSNTRTYRLKGLQPNTPYDWQVRSLYSTVYSPMQYFRTVCNSPLLTYTKTVSRSSATLAWNNDDSHLTYVVYWRKAGVTQWAIVKDITGGMLSLSELTPNTAYEWRVSTICGNTETPPQGPIRQFWTNTPDTGTLFTIRNGDWNDPGTWACNRIPSSADAVTIGHIVTVPTGITGNALRIGYGAGGKLIIGAGSKVRLGP
jgi:trimeric autotransporter adhesin